MLRWLKSNNTSFNVTVKATAKVTALSLLSISLTGSSWLILGGGFWSLHEAIAPLSAQAATERRTITITRQYSETYQSMLRRAESAVRTEAQQLFDRNALTTDVVVTALGQHGGAITPMLALEVNRQNWRTSPNPQSWATYYNDAQALLLLAPVATTSPAPTTPTVAPTPSPARTRGTVPTGVPLPPPNPGGSTPPPNNTGTPNTPPGDSEPPESVIF
jgi:hypothetical protein